MASTTKRTTTRKRKKPCATCNACAKKKIARVLHEEKRKGCNLKKKTPRKTSCQRRAIAKALSMSRATCTPH